MPPSDSAAARRHLEYEIYMLRKTEQMHGAARAKANAFLESSLVHARVLIEFLLSRPSKDRHTDDIQPSTILGREWSPPPDLHEAADRLRGKLRLLDKRLAHLTRDRLHGPAVWTDELFQDLNAVLDEFLKDLETEQPETAQRWRSIHIDADTARPFGHPTTT